MTNKLGLLGLIILAVSSASQADPVLWEIQGLAFSDGASGTGFFILDLGLEKFWDWNVVISPGASGESLTGFDYTPQTSLAIAGPPGCTVEFVASHNASPSLCLNTKSKLVAGAAPAILGISHEDFGAGERFVATGALSDPRCSECAVPEPSSVNLAGLGFLGLFTLLAFVSWRPPIS